MPRAGWTARSSACAGGWVCVGGWVRVSVDWMCEGKTRVAGGHCCTCKQMVHRTCPDAHMPTTWFPTLTDRAAGLATTARTTPTPSSCGPSCRITPSSCSTSAARSSSRCGAAGQLSQQGGHDHLLVNLNSPAHPAMPVPA